MSGELRNERKKKVGEQRKSGKVGDLIIMNRT